ncbi:MFS transporter [Paraburkholderia diazotrophica]|uniref:Predicted arabinose efflux permease, MFS family n=1 Tax=Paraburkholderia diazotrophica TaxID=667676 RepID=A0A1H6WMJ7_9BURK|nr:MFS transporter [Paraburkholderia diazotrophica]SEJ16404.1 Predicted arabinose efflux permease, MFS family [Paraburkholderia diazotrophica]
MSTAKPAHATTHSTTLATTLKNPTFHVIVAAALILSAAMGIRQTFGLFIGPFSYDRGLPVTLIAFAIALHNLVWGFAQPFAGAAADRYGAAPVVAFGATTFAAGLALAAGAPSGLALIAGLGLLVGIGVSCTTFGVVLTSVGRVASAEQRSMAMGIASAGGSLGQVLMVPFAQTLRETSGVSTSLFALAFLMLIAAPLGIVLDRRGRGADMSHAVASHAAVSAPATSLRETLAHATRHRGYRLLTLGFFTCGFQLAFIATHLPGYLTLCHMPMGLGATALALIGLFNMAGSWACGWLGGRLRQQHVLGWLYLIRGATIASFFLLPKSTLSVVLFAAVMGLTWLGTVPLTSGLIAKVFGTRHLGTLFGVVFLSHQLGSFLGAWLGGFVFDMTGSYSLIWGATALAGLFAALLHFPIDDTVHASGASVETARA